MSPSLGEFATGSLVSFTSSDSPGHSGVSSSSFRLVLRPNTMFVPTQHSYSLIIFCFFYRLLPLLLVLSQFPAHVPRAILLPYQRLVLRRIRGPFIHNISHSLAQLIVSTGHLSRYLRYNSIRYANALSHVIFNLSSKDFRRVTPAATSFS